MAARRTDKQKKKIVADYVELQSVNAAAKRNHVAWATAKSAIEEDKEIEKKLEQKKEENTADIFRHMEARKDKICKIIDIGLEVLPEKIRNAKTASEISTTLGTLIDKWAPKGQSISERNQIEDDPITKSLKEEMHGVQ